MKSFLLLLCRTAVNDVSGVFVQRAIERARTANSQVDSTTHQSAQGNRHPQQHIHRIPEAHQRHYVAPRTVNQMFSTLLWAVVLLFLTSLSARFLALAADTLCTAVANHIEIDEERLTAKVQEMNEDPPWGVTNPDGLEEADFLYLLQLQRDPRQSHERALTLNCYGVFLAAAKRWREAEEHLREAIRLNPADSIPSVNLGHLLRDGNRLKEAEETYRTALRLDTDDGRVYYDLGLVLAETNRPVEAEEAFRHAVTLAPKDP